MLAIPEDEAIDKLETLLTELGETEAELSKTKTEVDNQVKAIVVRHAPAIDSLTARRAVLVDGIASIFTQHRDFLTEGTGKTATLRGGTLSARFAAEALEIVDETKVEKFLRRKGRWLKYSKAVKRKLDKAALKKDRALVESAPSDVMFFRKDENLIIKLPKLQLEIKRVLNPLRSRLGDKN